MNTVFKQKCIWAFQEIFKMLRYTLGGEILTLSLAITVFCLLGFRLTQEELFSRVGIASFGIGFCSAIVMFLAQSAERLASCAFYFARKRFDYEKRNLSVPIFKPCERVFLRQGQIRSRTNARSHRRSARPSFASVAEGDDDSDSDPDRRKFLSCTAPLKSNQLISPKNTKAVSLKTKRHLVGCCGNYCIPRLLCERRDMR
ncbi:MAG: hypothetical protein LBS53_02330 [Synergistaceae bacterium]|jgi:hypothetical protein|nr:hypothetical protein [Synergistaceae bacterium]